VLSIAVLKQTCFSIEALATDGYQHANAARASPDPLCPYCSHQERER
jgi:hypothetical protein